jgi:hypothetical protein
MFDKTSLISSESVSWKSSFIVRPHVTHSDEIIRVGFGRKLWIRVGSWKQEYDVRIRWLALSVFEENLQEPCKIGRPIRVSCPYFLNPTVFQGFSAGADDFLTGSYRKVNGTKLQNHWDGPLPIIELYEPRLPSSLKIIIETKLDQCTHIFVYMHSCMMASFFALFIYYRKIIVGENQFRIASEINDIRFPDIFFPFFVVH